MEYIVGRRVPVQRVAVAPFAVVSSECNVIAAITLQGIHLFEVVAAVNRVEPFQFDHRIIATPEKVNSIQEADINRLAINRDINFGEIHDVFLDRTISTERVTDEPLSTAFRQVAWSPLGLLSTGRCVLATVTADHRVVLYRSARWNWEETDNASLKLIQHLRDKNWETDPAGELEEGRSAIFARHKSRSYLLGTMAMGWSRLFNGSTQWAWFVTLQRSGHIVVWKAEAPFNELALVDMFDLHVEDPSAIKVYPGCTEKQSLVFVGSHRGLVTCWLLSQTEGDKPTCTLISDLIKEEDHIPVGTIEVKSVTGYLVVITTKNSALVLHSVQFDGANLTVFKTDFVDLPSLQITGLTKLNSGKIVCVTEDYHVIEIDLTVDAAGLFLDLKPRKLMLPASPTMLCRGITSCFPFDGTAFFVIESVRVLYDHLKCRHPTNLIVYANANPEKVMRLLESTESLSHSLIALETYKALNRANWESIWEVEMEGAESEDDCYLQLIRWFALLKCNACFVERRYDKECQDALKSRAEKAAFILQVRHFQRKQARYVDRKEEELSKSEKLLISLSTHFLESKKVREPAIPLDQALLDKIKSRFDVRSEAFQEKCDVCSEPIEFNSHEEGQCSNGHRSLRCSASLRCCFARTLKCKWCGTHYHPDTGLSNCILCDGPVVL